MSTVWIVMVSLGGAFLVCVAFTTVYFGIADKWFRAEGWGDEPKKPKPFFPEVGTIRIVEKMDDAGAMYYVAEKFTSEWHTHGFHFTWERVGDKSGVYPTPEDAQQAVMREEETTRCRNYSKVMGEFKP